MANEEVIKCDRCNVEIDEEMLNARNLDGEDVYCENCHYDLYGKKKISYYV